MQTREELILKLFANECSEEELKLLLQMIREDQSGTAPEVMDELFKQIKDSETVEKATYDRVWKKVAERASDPKQETIKIRPLWRRSRFVLRIAAAVALILVSLFVVQYFLTENWVVHQSVAGQVQEVTLPDGSLVTLNGNSSIRYLKDWSKDPIRTVELEGEAYFKVRNFGDGTTKFQVVTSDLTIEVLGTSFNVTSWEEETGVFLEEGEINVKLENSDDQEVRLEPGELLRYSAKEQKLEPPRRVANELEVSWKQGMLEFVETPLEDILQRLASPNNLSYTISDEILAKREFTLRIPTADMGTALDLLSRLTGTNIEQVDDQLVIQEKTSSEDE
ncbi:MAG: FecR domain-containing protein [Saprospiraceae bacterium]|nr:FecR domain-containing protein [Saprospiraceae bacterium]